MPSNRNNLVRTYFYQGELLQLADFVRDQQYVRDLVSAQNASLFSSGVVTGLALSASGTVLTAAAGFAFDGNGVPLLVAQSTSLDVSGLQLAAGTYYASLAYADDTAGNVTNLRSTHTITEQPGLQAPSQAVPTGPAIVLGTLTIGSDGSITGVDQSPASKRQLATVLLPTAAPKALAAPAPVDPPSAASASAASSGSGSTAAGSALDGSTDALRGPLSVGPLPPDPGAQLRVSEDLTASPPGASVARFERLEKNAPAALVRIHAARADGTRALLSAEVDGKEVWSLGEDGSAHTVSDRALKVDVRPVEDALGLISALRPVSFAWAERPGARRLGLIAQEVEQVLPELVGRTTRGYATVAYGELVPLLVQAVRELSEQVRRLSAKAGAP